MSNKPIKTIHEFKKRYFPHSYKQELEEQLTDEERVELIVRKSLKPIASQQRKPLDAPKSIRVASIEELEQITTK